MIGRHQQLRASWLSRGSLERAVVVFGTVIGHRHETRSKRYSRMGVRSCADCVERPMMLRALCDDALRTASTHSRPVDGRQRELATSSAEAHSREWAVVVFGAVIGKPSSRKPSGPITPMSAVVDNIGAGDLAQASMVGAWAVCSFRQSRAAIPPECSRRHRGGFVGTIHRGGFVRTISTLPVVATQLATPEGSPRPTGTFLSRRKLSSPTERLPSERDPVWKQRTGTQPA